MTGERAEQSPNHDARAQVRLTDQARDALTVAGRASHDRERGGLLVGYREGLSVIVEDALQVSDPTAAHNRYLRRQEPAEKALTSYLERLDRSTAAYVGYVGEWHTHPRPEPPSPYDHAAMRTMVRRNRHLVAMIVVARNADSCVQFHGLASVTGTLRDRLAGRHAAVPVGTT